MNESFNNKPQNELDIVAMFEYFKNGIKSVFRRIANFFKWIFRQILNLLYLIFKNWWLVFGLMLLFGLLGLFKNQWLGQKYKYEMVVEPKLNSTFEMYDHISGLSAITKSQLQDLKGFEGIEAIIIEPVKRYMDEVELYYSVPKSKVITGAPDMYGFERDTVFYRSTEFKEFKTEIDLKDYPVHKIVVKSSNELQTDQLKSLILKPFQNNYWQSVKQARMNRLEQREKIIKTAISRSDSLLRAYAINPEFNRSAELNISGSSAKNNVELDILNQLKGFGDQLEYLQYQLSNSDQIITVLSDFKRVEDDSMRSYLNLWSGLLIGLLLSLGILLMRYLLKFFKTYQPR